jgi:hypothetical protein
MSRKISKNQSVEKVSKNMLKSTLHFGSVSFIAPLSYIKYNSVIPVHSTHPNQQVFHEAPQNSTGP